MTEEPEQPEAQLVMPFVAVASHGGPFDDQAYTAGYEMGLLDALLGHPYSFGSQCGTFREENRGQVDLLAMRHGWKVAFTELGEGWIGVEFVRVDEKLDRLRIEEGNA